MRVNDTPSSKCKLCHRISGPQNTVDLVRAHSCLKFSPGRNRFPRVEIKRKEKERNLIKYQNWPRAKRVWPERKAAGLKRIQNFRCFVASLWARPGLGTWPSICLPILSVYGFSSFFIFNLRTHLSAQMKFSPAFPALGSKLGIQNRCPPWLSLPGRLFILFLFLFLFIFHRRL